VARTYQRSLQKGRELRDRLRQRRENRQRNREKNAADRLNRAVTAIRPQAEGILARGIARRLLAIRLAYWRLRYRLSRLFFDDHQIVAEVNPRDVVTPAEILRRQEIGRRLEPILQAAEAEFFRRREAARSSIEVAHVAEAARATTAGSRHFLGLRPADQVQFFRGIQAGRIPLPPPRPPKRPGARPRSPTVRPGPPGFTTLINDPDLLSRAFVVGAGKYPLSEEQLDRPSTEGLVRALEPARSGGVFAARQVAEGLVKEGFATNQEIGSGSLAPLAATGAARAAEVDAGLRPPSQAGSAERIEEDKARLTRHERIGNIFERLRSILRNPPFGEIATTKDQSQALTRLAEAFENWLKANLPAEGVTVSAEEATAAAAALQAKLVAFLATLN
jgi:hypothetical protein